MVDNIHEISYEKLVEDVDGSEEDAPVESENGDNLGNEGNDKAKKKILDWKREYYSFFCEELRNLEKLQKKDYDDESQKKILKTQKIENEKTNTKAPNNNQDETINNDNQKNEIDIFIKYSKDLIGNTKITTENFLTKPFYVISEKCKNFDSKQLRNNLKLNGQKEKPSKVIEIKGMALSPDHCEIAILQGGNCSIYNLTGNKKGKIIKVSSSVLLSVSYSPCGRKLVFGSTIGEILYFDAETGDRKDAPDQNNGKHAIRAIGFSRNGDLLLTGCDDGQLRFFKEEDSMSGYKECTKNILGDCQIYHHEGLCTFAFSPNGENLITGGHDKILNIYDFKKTDVDYSCIPVKTLTPHSGIIRVVKYSNDGKYFLTGSYDSRAKLFDAKTAEEIRIYKGHTGSIFAVDISSDNRFIITGSEDTYTFLFDSQTAEILAKFDGSDSEALNIRAALFWQDGSVVLTAGKEGVIKFYSIDEGHETLKNSVHKGGINSIDFSHDKTKIVTGGVDSTVRVYDLKMGWEIRKFTAHEGEVFCVAFAPNGKYILSGGNDSYVKLIDFISGAIVNVLHYHTEWISSVLFSPDSDFFVSSSMDKRIHLYNMVGEIQQTFPKQFSTKTKELKKNPIDMRYDDMRVNTMIFYQKREKGSTNTNLLIAGGSQDEKPKIKLYSLLNFEEYKSFFPIDDDDLEDEDEIKCFAATESEDYLAVSTDKRILIYPRKAFTFQLNKNPKYDYLLKIKGDSPTLQTIIFIEKTEKNKSKKDLDLISITREHVSLYKDIILNNGDEEPQVLLEIDKENEKETSDYWTGGKFLNKEEIILFTNEKSAPLLYEFRRENQQLSENKSKEFNSGIEELSFSADGRTIVGCCENNILKFLNLYSLESLVHRNSGNIGNKGTYKYSRFIENNKVILVKENKTIESTAQIVNKNSSETHKESVNTQTFIELYDFNESENNYLKFQDTIGDINIKITSLIITKTGDGDDKNSGYLIIAGVQYEKKVKENEKEKEKEKEKEGKGADRIYIWKLNTSASSPIMIKLKSENKSDIKALSVIKEENNLNIYACFADGSFNCFTKIFEGTKDSKDSKDSNINENLVLKLREKINCAKTSIDYKKIILGGEDKRVRLFDLESKSDKEFERYSSAIIDVALFPDNFYGVSTTKQGEIRVFEIDTNITVYLLQEEFAIKSVAVSPIIDTIILGTECGFTVINRVLNTRSRMDSFCKRVKNLVNDNDENGNIKLVDEDFTEDDSSIIPYPLKFSFLNMILIFHKDIVESIVDVATILKEETHSSKKDIILKSVFREESTFEFCPWDIWMRYIKKSDIKSQRVYEDLISILSTPNLKGVSKMKNKNEFITDIVDNYPSKLHCVLDTFWVEDDDINVKQFKPPNIKFVHYIEPLLRLFYCKEVNQYYGSPEFPIIVTSNTSFYSVNYLETKYKEFMNSHGRDTQENVYINCKLSYSKIRLSDLFKKEDKKFFLSIFSKFEPEHEVFKSKLLTFVVNYLWNVDICIGYNFYRKMFFYLIFLFIICFNTLYLIPEREINFKNNPEDAFNYFVFSFLIDCLLLILLCLQLIYKSYIMFAMRINKESQGISWYIFDCLILLLGSVASISDLDWITNHQNSSEQDVIYTKYFLGLFMGCSWFRLIKYARGLSSTSTLVRILVQVTFDMKTYLLIILFMIVGVAFSTSILQTSYERHDHWHLFQTFYYILIGDIEDYRKYDRALNMDLFFIIFFLTTVYVVILMMNLLIAIISNSFDSVLKKEAQTETYEKLHMILERFSQFYHFDKDNFYKCIPNLYLFQIQKLIEDRKKKANSEYTMEAKLIDIELMLKNMEQNLKNVPKNIQNSMIFAEILKRIEVMEENNKKFRSDFNQVASSVENINKYIEGKKPKDDNLIVPKKSHYRSSASVDYRT